MRDWEQARLARAVDRSNRSTSDGSTRSSSSRDAVRPCVRRAMPCRPRPAGRPVGSVARRRPRAVVPAPIHRSTCLDRSTTRPAGTRSRSVPQPASGTHTRSVGPDRKRVAARPAHPRRRHRQAGRQSQAPPPSLPPDPPTPPPDPPTPPPDPPTPPPGQPLARIRARIRRPAARAHQKKSARTKKKHQQRRGLTVRKRRSRGKFGRGNAPERPSERRLPAQQNGDEIWRRFLFSLCVFFALAKASAFHAGVPCFFARPKE